MSLYGTCPRCGLELHAEYAGNDMEVLKCTNACGYSRMENRAPSSFRIADQNTWNRQGCGITGFSRSKYR